MDLGELLRLSAAKAPRKAALICGDQTIAYQELDRATSGLAHRLLREGLQPGDRVAIHWCNSVETVYLYFACFKAGLIAVPVNNRLKAPEIAYVLSHSQAKVCFSQPELSHLSEAARRECPGLRHIFTTLPAATDESAAPLPAVAPNHVAAILYTSGTTARPKGVMHTHISLIGGTQLVLAMGVDETHTLLAGTQMLHIAALACVLLTAISCGATVALLPAFEAGAALDLIERARCTFLLVLPAMLRLLVEEQGRAPRDAASVRLCLAGGDTVPLALQRRFRELFGAPVRELFGMTESVLVTCNREGAWRAGSLGPAVDLVDVRVADAAGQALPDGLTGELQVQSPGNCVGYWNDPLTTDGAFDDGWLRTGDLARRDAGGFYWFEGRVKQIIVRGGSNISPQEVEEALYRHPAVAEAGVIGMPDAAQGEMVIAFVALREGQAASEPELRQMVRSRIADYKTPERVLFLPSLPKGFTGKVDRRSLKNLASAVEEVEHHRV